MSANLACDYARATGVKQITKMERKARKHFPRLSFRNKHYAAAAARINPRYSPTRPTRTEPHSKLRACGA
ncbi:MAG: hypothetical protein ACPGWR_12700 [Ardenticatenaceae bacterium]